MQSTVFVVQVSVYDTINKDAQYSLKVRRLGEYHPGLAATKDQEGQDIGDPLYGNAGGVDELVGIQSESAHRVMLGYAVVLVYLSSSHLLNLFDLLWMFCVTCNHSIGI